MCYHDISLLQVRDDEGLIGVYCGREPPPIISTIARGLHLVYHFNDADNIHRESFFKALYAISGTVHDYNSKIHLLYTIHCICVIVDSYR